MYNGTYTPEHAALGCAMVDSSAMDYMTRKLTPDDFGNGDLADLYKEMLTIYRQRGQFTQEDALCIQNRGLATECLRAVAGYGGLDGARRWIDRVKEDAVRHEIASVALGMAGAQATIEDLQAATAKITDLLRVNDDNAAIVDAPTVAVQWLEAQNRRKDDQIKTGLACLDSTLRLSKGQFLAVGGRPSAGKTALGLQLMLNMARAGHRCVFFSLETDHQGLFDKMAACWGFIPLEDIVYKRRPPQDDELAQVAAELSELPLYLVNAAGKTVQWMASVAAAKNADVIFVDYIQLVPSKGGSRYEQVTRISMDLHTLAQQSGRLVVGLAQMNRQGDGAAPSMRDLKESGQIEQDADAIILLAKLEDGYYFTIAKNKRGRIGRKPIQFDAVHQRFVEVDRGR